MEVFILLYKGCHNGCEETNIITVSFNEQYVKDVMSTDFYDTLHNNYDANEIESEVIMNEMHASIKEKTDNIVYEHWDDWSIEKHKIIE